MSPEQIAALDKIKKLMRMKRGGTPDEIATALRLAQELAEKHGINLSDVNPDDESEQRERPIGHEDQILGARVQWECKYAMLIAQAFFNVTTFIRSDCRRHNGRFRRLKCVAFVGTEWDRQVAVYVYTFLCRHMRREWATKRGRCRNRQAFMYGMYVGIHSKLRERQPQPATGSALVPVDKALARRDKYVEENFGELKSLDMTVSGDAEASKRAGYKAGLETEIRGGLSNRNEQGQALVGNGSQLRIQ